MAIIICSELLFLTTVDHPAKIDCSGHGGLGSNKGTLRPDFQPNI
jgi:hypothetical protein